MNCFLGREGIKLVLPSRKMRSVHQETGLRHCGKEASLGGGDDDDPCIASKRLKYFVDYQMPK